MQKRWEEMVATMEKSPQVGGQGSLCAAGGFLPEINFPVDSYVSMSPPRKTHAPILSAVLTAPTGAPICIYSHRPMLQMTRVVEILESMAVRYSTCH